MESDSVKAFFCLHGSHQDSISSRFGRAVVYPSPSKERVAHKTGRNRAQGCTLKNNLILFQFSLYLARSYQAFACALFAGCLV